MLSWTHHVNWLNVLFIIVIPLYGFIQAYWVPLQTKTALWAIFYYFYTGIGITAGTYPPPPPKNPTTNLIPTLL